MIYFSGSIIKARHPNLGFMLTPDMWNSVPKDAMIAADNACFNNPAGYSDERYFTFLEKLPRGMTAFATAPDVLCDHAATVERGRRILPMLRQLGFRPAFVAQDGWDEATTPWGEFDVLFVGGSTEFKFRGGQAAVAAAKTRGLSAHMGRVNSLDRMRAARAIGCDSCDGTHLKFRPDQYWRDVLGWFEAVNTQPELAFHKGE